MAVKYEVRFPRDRYDYWLKWISDSWPTYKNDRYTDSEVAPGWFQHALTRRWSFDGRELKKVKI